MNKTDNIWGNCVEKTPVGGMWPWDFLEAVATLSPMSINQKLLASVPLHMI